MHGAWPWPPARLATLPRATPFALPTSSKDHELIRAPRAIHQPINPTATQIVREHLPDIEVEGGNRLQFSGTNSIPI